MYDTKRARYVRAFQIMQQFGCVAGRKCRWCRTGTVVGRDRFHGKGSAEEAAEAGPD